MSKRNRSARRNAEKRKLKGLINERKADNERNKSKQTQNSLPLITNGSFADSPAQTSHSEKHDASKSAQNGNAVMRMLVAISSPIKHAFRFLDAHQGSITTMATVVIAVLTAIYAKYSKEQWIAMQKSNILTQQAFEHSSRSWIEIIPPVQLGKIHDVSDIANLAFEAPMYNPGHTPAKHIVAYATVEVVDKGASANFRYVEATDSGMRLGLRETTAIIFPGPYPTDLARPPHVINIHSYRSNGWEVSELSAKERADLTSGNSYLVWYARVTYADDYGSHWTQFCWWKSFVNGYYNSRSCADYNGAGDEKTQ
jgi:hypothetical protein